MPVYIDDMRAPLKGMVMCHMLADTSAELLAIADQIGLSRRWIQCPGTAKEHFDISLAYRQKAKAAGAQEISKRAAIALIRQKRNAGKGHANPC